MGYIFIFLWMLIGLLLVIVSMRWERRRSAALIDRWAQAQGYQVLERQSRLFDRGPFFWRTSKGQTVYYITLRDEQGQVRQAWLRCGNWFLGLWSDEVAVEWEQPQQYAAIRAQ